ncbi:NAD-dependent deacetylase [Streptoalloteichus tenebrarius]|uniref:protein acetyllysine N-acetyltransferase n=1 Tax=Streptoalloteichus tenebrarius (strain ATCC 17920 / DSM 40477 / JCM 4838 / CBS 697.72 / NBRC 16177 / NCIMB 11028 / NRRL B-12390 / A12253. 1 / ISP 5477) TaxID=1933 RepID=A0ABT1HR14_STRSD|nr:Sir2 family NAD-dependent protein deacetylase [Streptoalloteichus tenebrarius]MCP2257885.1 NAD-dependent deacetylase [Streptoalloteichus tenebrarius]BFE99753.1 NAD-dependent protein deacetylase [Streptoalloteichus tenebrarius]
MTAQDSPHLGQGECDDAAAQWARARELFASARRITVLTGAGVSTDSGIPDFRGPQGLWTTHPEAQRLYTLQAYMADREVRRLAWRHRAEHPAWRAEPNAAHRALVDLERGGRLRALLTQNIDELHQRAGSSPELVVELHGSLFGTVCTTCGARGTMADALRRVAAGEDDPHCEGCYGILKSTTVSFGQALDPEVLRRAQEAALDCDLLLAAGTSLTVQPAAGLVGLAAKAGASVVICNAERTPYDCFAAAVLRSPVAVALPELVAVPVVAGPPARVVTWGDPSTWE